MQVGGPVLPLTFETSLLSEMKQWFPEKIVKKNEMVFAKWTVGLKLPTLSNF